MFENLYFVVQVNLHHVLLKRKKTGVSFRFRPYLFGETINVNLQQNGAGSLTYDCFS